MTFWTLEYNGVEKTFEAWGIQNNPRRKRVNRGTDVFSFCQVFQDGNTTPLFLPFAKSGGNYLLIIVRRDRILTAGTFSGGVLVFTGIPTKVSLNHSSDTEEHSYEISGPWFFLTQTVYRQEWKARKFYFNGVLTHVDISSFSSPHVFLNTDIDNAYLNTGGQISKALDWAISVGIPLQYDTTDFPAVNIRIDEAKGIMVSEVIERMLRWSPDAVLWFDYSTSPPTLRCKRRINLGLVSLQLPNVNPTTSISGVNLSPRYDLQIPCVDLFFEVTQTIDGNQRVVHFEQRYPMIAAGGDHDTTGLEPFTLAAPIELEGVTVVHEYAQVVTSVIATGDPEWWKKKVSWLADDHILDLLFDAGTFVISNPNPPYDAPAEYLNELVSGNWVNWIPIDGGGVPSHAQEVEFKVDVSYKLIKTVGGGVGDDNLAANVTRKQISFKVMTTDVVTGDYSRLSEVDSGEPVPVNLAKDLYEAVSVLQFDGGFDLVEEECTGFVGLGLKVNIEGAQTEYETMQAIVQEVDEDFENGSTHVTVGPPGNLSANDLIELMRMMRFRRVWRAPSYRTSATPLGSAINLGQQTPKIDSGSSDPSLKVLGVFGAVGPPAHAVVLDATGNALAITETNDTVMISTIDCGGHALRIRETSVCVGGVLKKCMVLRSDFYM